MIRFNSWCKQLQNIWFDLIHDSSENHLILIQFMIQIEIVYKSWLLVLGPQYVMRLYLDCWSLAFSVLMLCGCTWLLVLGPQCVSVHDCSSLTLSVLCDCAWLLVLGPQCVEAVEEALNSYLVHHDENESSKLQTFELELSRLLVSSAPEEVESILLAFIGQSLSTLTDTRTHAHTRIRTRTNKHTNTHTYIHIYIYTYIYIYMLQLVCEIS